MMKFLRSLISEKQSTIEIYQNARHHYCWRLRDTNGKIIADCSEGYVTETNCRRALANVRAEMERAVIKSLL